LVITGKSRHTKAHTRVQNIYSHACLQCSDRANMSSIWLYPHSIATATPRKIQGFT
jgi:hypothetical protein